MHVMLRLPCLAVVLLLAAPCIGAETPFTDPVPPAVVGRPLDRIGPARPARPARPKPVVIQPDRTRQAAADNKAVRKPQPARAAIPAPSRVAGAPKARSAAASPAPTAAATAAVLGNAPSPRAAKQAVDDRADTRPQAASEVGKGSRLATKSLDEGAYIGRQHQALVRRYYESNPASETTARWKIGEPVPRKAVLTGVPDDLRARLPVVPPGLQYVQVDGEVVLLAMQSRMVVDGVSRNGR